MARIKVTGYLDTDNLPDEFLDSSSPDGLSLEGYEAIVGINPIEGLENEGNHTLGDLEDIDMTLED